MRYLWIPVFFCVLSVGTALAEDLDATFAKVKQYAAKEEWSKALKELNWIKVELDKGHSAKIASLFPEKFGEFTATGKAKQEGALGMTQVERKYTGPSGSQVEASLSTGGMASGLGGLMALGGMGMMMGAQQQPGTDMFRIGDLTAIMQKEEGSRATKLMVTLKSGGILTFELRNGGEDAAQKLRTAVEKEFKVSDLDAYLAG